MHPLRLARTLACVIALLVGLASPARGQQPLTSQFDYFLVDGQPRFIVFFSYFDAMRASDATLTSDFAYLQSKGITGLRIMANWWDWQGAQPPVQAGDTLMDGAGVLRPARLARLKTILTMAAGYGFVVDLSFTCETVAGLTLPGFLAGLADTARELGGDGYRHVLFDLQNESTHISCGGIGVPSTNQNRLDMRNAVRNADPMRLVTASLESEGNTGTTVGRAVFAGFDVLAYHDPRGGTWYDRTDDVVIDFRNVANCPAVLTTTANSPDSTSCKPFYLQEPDYAAPNGQAYLTAVVNAKSAGAAAWTFHTQRAFRLTEQTVQTSLSTEEKNFMNGLIASLNATAWDGDGMKDSWFSFFNVSGGPGADADADGASNVSEFQSGHHPSNDAGLSRQFADGRNNTFYGATIALANPSSTVDARVLLRFIEDDGRTGSISRYLPPLSRVSIDVPRIPGMRESTFAIRMDTTARVAMERTERWDRVSNYGGHTERAVNVTTTSTAWYIAEGTTGGPFDTEVVLRNPSAAAITVNARYLLPSGAPITRAYTIGARARLTILVDNEPGMGSTDFGAEFTSATAFVAERAVYLTGEGRPYNAGNGAAAVSATSLAWHFAEGATGGYFETYLLMANPNASAAAVTATYRTTAGQVVTRNYTLPANSRSTIRVETEHPSLAAADFWFSVVSTNGVSFVAERSLWWPDGVWRESHSSPGEVSGAPNWILAEGEQGLGLGTSTFVIIANLSAAPDTVEVKVLLEGGGSAVTSIVVAAMSRATIDVGSSFPSAVNRRFATTVRSTSGPGQLVVERSMYWTANGIGFAAGTNAIGTKF
jgi:hypothetical protein